MFKLFKQEKAVRSNLFLALDIGTEMVKAYVCEAEGKQSVIRGIGEQRQKQGDIQCGSVMDIGSVIANAGKAIEMAQQQAHGYANEVIMGIAGELVKGVTSHTTYIRKEPHAKIDLSELKHILQKVEHKAFEETRAQFAAESGYNEVDIKLVNASIVDARVDGYKVANPIGFQGKEVQISLFNAFAPTVHFGALQTIAAELELNLMAITVEPYALARCLDTDESAIGSPTNAIFIDIGGGTTDIAVVRNGVIEGTKMFTIGGRTFTKRLATTLNISFEEAEDIKYAYAAEKLEKQSEKVVREAMWADAEVWLSGVVFTLEEFKLDPLPPRILLCGGGSHLPEIKAVLSQTNWAETLGFPRAPSVSILSPKQVAKVRDATRTLVDAEDVTPISLAKLGLEYMQEEHLMNKLLKNVIRLMQI